MPCCATPCLLLMTLLLFTSSVVNPIIMQHRPAQSAATEQPTPLSGIKIHRRTSLRPRKLPQPGVKPRQPPQSGVKNDQPPWSGPTPRQLPQPGAKHCRSPQLGVTPLQGSSTRPTSAALAPPTVQCTNTPTIVGTDPFLDSDKFTLANEYEVRDETAERCRLKGTYDVYLYI